ncbi:hypothetical protein GCM10027294_50300 [Marinactinospora endophytica]
MSYQGRGVAVSDVVVASAPVLVTPACTACGACLLTCPEHAIRPVHSTPRHDAQGRGAALVILVDRCTGCLECVEVCPADAVVEVSGPVHEHAGGIRP